MLMRDIYCSANILLKQHGPAAKSHAIQRVQELRASGDEKGALVWMGIIDAIAVLELSEPPEEQTTH